MLESDADLAPVMAFVQAPPGSGKDRVLRDHPELLTEEHVIGLARVAAQASENDLGWAKTVKVASEFLAWRLANPDRGPGPPGRVGIAPTVDLQEAFETLASDGPYAACARHPELRTHYASELTAAILQEAITIGDIDTERTFSVFPDALDAARVVAGGIVAEQVSKRPVPNEILDGIRALLVAADWSEAADVVQRHGLVSEDGLLAMLYAVCCAWDDGDPVSLDRYREHWHFLVHANVEGLEAAIAAQDAWVDLVPELIRVTAHDAGTAANAAIAAGSKGELRAAWVALEGVVVSLRDLELPATYRGAVLASAGSAALGLDRLDRDDQLRAVAVERLREAAGLLPVPLPGRAICLHQLGVAMRQTFEVSGHESDLRSAVEAFTEAADVGMMFSEVREICVQGAAEALRTLADFTGTTEPLEQRDALLATDLGASGGFAIRRADCAVRYGLAGSDRYRRFGDEVALDSAITVLRTEVARIEWPALRSSVQRQLGFLLLDRYLGPGGVDDLTSASEVLGEAIVNSRPGSAVRSVALDHMAAVMIEEYLRTGDVAYLDQSVGLAEEAQTQLQSGESPVPLAATTLANALLLRHEVSGEKIDLDRAMQLAEHDAVPESDSDERSAKLIGVGMTLYFGYLRSGEIGLLDQAVDSLDAALASATESSIGRPGAASNLVTVLIARERLPGHPDDLDRIVELSRNAVDERAAHSPRLAGALGNLGNALVLRWKRRNREDDLTEAIAVLERGVDLAVDGSDQAWSNQANLAGALAERAEGDDLDQAISLLEASSAAAGDGTYERLRRLLTLGAVYSERGADGDGERAGAAFREVVDGGLELAPELSLAAAHGLSGRAAEEGRWSEAAAAADKGLLAMRELFDRQLNRAHKGMWIASASGLAARGAYAYWQARRAEDAVATLEAGRGLLLREALRQDDAELAALVERGREDLVGRYRASVARIAALSTELALPT